MHVIWNVPISSLLPSWVLASLQGHYTAALKHLLPDESDHESLPTYKVPPPHALARWAIRHLLGLLMPGKLPVHLVQVGTPCHSKVVLELTSIWDVFARS